MSPQCLSRSAPFCALVAGLLSRVCCGRRFSGFPQHSLCFTPVGLDCAEEEGSSVFLRTSGQEWSRFLWVFRLLFYGFVWAWYKSVPVEGITTVGVCAVTPARVLQKAFGGTAKQCVICKMIFFLSSAYIGFKIKCDLLYSCSLFFFLACFLWLMSMSDELYFLFHAHINVLAY